MVVFKGLFGSKHVEGSTIVNSGSISGGDGAILLEGRPEPSHLFERGAAIGVLVLIDDNGFLAGLDLYRAHFIFEASGIKGRDRLLLRGNGEGILRLPGDAVFFGNVLSCNAHVHLVESVG